MHGLKFSVPRTDFSLLDLIEFNISSMATCHAPKIDNLQAYNTSTTSCFSLETLLGFNPSMFIATVRLLTRGSSLPPDTLCWWVFKPPFETSCLKQTYNRIKKNNYTIPWVSCWHPTVQFSYLNTFWGLFCLFYWWYTVERERVMGVGNWTSKGIEPASRIKQPCQCCHCCFYPLRPESFLEKVVSIKVLVKKDPKKCYVFGHWLHQKICCFRILHRSKDLN